jgi:mutator protein MutT
VGSSVERKIVVAALVVDRAGRVMLTQRSAGQPMEGLWELPGGKVEPGESPTVALGREIAEELGCGCSVGAIYEVVHHRYPRFELVLLVYRTQLLGTPRPVQVADIRWVPPVELTRYEVLPADVELVARIARAGRVDPAPAPRTTFDGLTRDPATGCLKPHFLRLRLDEELDRAQRYARPLALLFADIDDLSALNDRYGRAAGDAALGQLAALMIQNARAVDRVGRLAAGGFVLILPETPAGAAYGIAERLRADVAARRFAGGLRHKALRCTVSCGVAAMRGQVAGEAQGLLGRADAALWRAKLAGRNRTVVDSAA